MQLNKSQLPFSYEKGDLTCLNCQLLYLNLLSPDKQSAEKAGKGKRNTTKKISLTFNATPRYH